LGLVLGLVLDRFQKDAVHKPSGTLADRFHHVTAFHRREQKVRAHNIARTVAHAVTKARVFMPQAGNHGEQRGLPTGQVIRIFVCPAVIDPVEDRKSSGVAGTAAKDQSRLRLDHGQQSQVHLARLLGTFPVRVAKQVLPGREDNAFGRDCGLFFQFHWSAGRKRRKDNRISLSDRGQHAHLAGQFLQPG